MEIYSSSNETIIYLIGKIAINKCGRIIITMEATNIEQEASAPLILNIIEENNIESLALDLDNTFLMTNEYYWFWQDNCSAFLADSFKVGVEKDVFVERMAYNLRLEYNEKALLPIRQKYLNALDRYFGENQPENYKGYKKTARKFLEDFYKESPDMIEGSDSFLRLIYRIGLPFVFNSNAQYGWTKTKIDVFEEEIGAEIPFNAVDISKRKDAQTWIRSVDKIGKSIETTLVIGDSLVADILPAIEAGCKNLVWIKGDLKKLPFEITDNPDIHIWCVDSVKDLL